MPPLSSMFRSPPAPARDELSRLPWRRQVFVTYPVAPDEQLVMVHGETPIRVPSFVVDFVLECSEFRPLERQVSQHAERHGWGSLEMNALTSWMPRLMEAGLLISAEDVHRQCLSASKDHEPCAPPKMRTIGMPTGGDRVDLAQRAIASFARNAAEHGREVEFLIADSSTTDAQRRAFRTGLRAPGAKVWYAGEEEKRRFVAHLVRAGLDPEPLEFGLFDPLQTGFICGANRNALLLHQAGRAFACVDDDVVCELAAAKPSNMGLKLFSQADPYVRRVYHSREETIASGRFAPCDFLGAHETMLGRRVGDLCRNVEARALDVSQMNDDLLDRLWHEAPVVRATFTGHIGDPGIPTSVYYLYYEDENRRRLTENEVLYRAALAGRNLSAHVAQSAIGDASLSPGMAMGLDHRDLLPPFFPVLHAEDFVFGAALWQCAPDAVLGHLPLAIRHEPRPGKSILQPSDFGRERPVVIFEFAHLVRRSIFSFGGQRGQDTATRMRLLGRHLSEIAAQPAPDFLEHLRLQIIQHESVKCDRLEEQLRTATDIPDYWHEDVAAYLDQVRDALTASDFDLPLDLKGGRTDDGIRALMQQLVARFGTLLEAWPDIVAAARECGARENWMVELPA
ncbi:MAG: hypothetical protein ABI680_08305 [Chthoniobacteraceae bacterium]